MRNPATSLLARVRLQFRFPPETGLLPRSASASPTNQFVSMGAMPALRVVRARSTNDCRACWSRRRESRRRSRSIPSRASDDRIRSPAGCRAILASSPRYAAGVCAPGCVRAVACRRCAPRSGSRSRGRCARATARECRRAVLPDSCECRSTMPSAATHRRRASHPAAPARSLHAPARRSQQEMQPTSCPIP